MTTYAHAGFFPPSDFPNQRGTPTPSKSVGIYDVGTDNLATLYTDRDRSASAANPLTLDINGNSPGFFAEVGDYDARRVTGGTPETATVRITVAVDDEDAILEPTGTEADYLGTVADEPAMLALAPASVGDWAIRSDTSTEWRIVTGDGSVIGDWVELPYPVTSVDGLTGAVVLPSDAAAGVGSKRTLGTGAAQAAAGNDARLSDARIPTGAAAGVLSGTYPAPGFAVDMATQAELDAEAATARNADNLSSGTVADARIPATIARDTEVSSAVAAEAALARDASNLSSGTVAIARLPVDTDGTLAANSDAVVPSQRAVKTYADQLIAAADALVFKGVIDASTNPNYPAADKGWTYRISVAGKIGGAAGVNVEVGDLIICLVDGSPAGTQAAVGANWSVAQGNVDGAVIGPAGAASDNFPTFDGVTGRLIKDSGLSFDNATVGTGSALRIPSQYAVKVYADAVAAASVPNALYDANTILIANVDDTPLALAVGASTIVGRKASGGIGALTPTETKTVLAITEGDVANLTADLALKAPLASPTFSGTVTFGDGVNLDVGTTTGTKIGTATTEKLGFYNATPVAQIAGSVDVLAGLVTLGFRAASSNPPLNLGTGALTAGTTGVGALTATSIAATGTVALTGTMTVSDAVDVAVGTVTGTKIGSGATQKLGFFGATPVVQESGSNDVLASLVTLGLRAASSNPNLNLGTGAITAGQTNVGALSVSSGTGTISGGGIQAASGSALFLGTAGANTLQLQTSATTRLTIGSTGGFTIADANDVVLGTTTGTKIGTATTQKLGFYNATPVVQPAGSTDVLASLVTLGLRAASSNPPLNLGSGALTAGGVDIGTVGTIPAAPLRVIGSFIIAADSNTDNTNKQARYVGAAYVTAQIPIGGIDILGQTAANQLQIGGGTSAVQACTQLNFWTASAVNTATGTQKMVLDGNGSVIIGIPISNSVIATGGLTIYGSASQKTLALRANATTPDNILENQNSSGTVLSGFASTGNVFLTDVNMALSATTGTKIGTATTQKLGFFNATPVVQEAGSNDVLASLVTLGLRAASSNPGLDLGTGFFKGGGLRSPSGTALVLMALGSNTLQIGTNNTTRLSLAGADGTITFSDAVNMTFNATTGTKIGTATTGKIGFWNATPVIQPTRVGAIVDNSGGSSTSPTIPAVVAASVDASAASLTSTKNAVASLAAAIAAIETRLSAAAGGVGITA